MSADDGEAWVVPRWLPVTILVVVALLVIQLLLAFSDRCWVCATQVQVDGVVASVEGADVCLRTDTFLGEVTGMQPLRCYRLGSGVQPPQPDELVEASLGRPWWRPWWHWRSFSG